MDKNRQVLTVFMLCQNLDLKQILCYIVGVVNNKPEYIANFSY